MTNKMVTMEQLLESARQGEALTMQVAQAANTALGEKQDKLTGTAGQVVGFDADGNPEPQAASSTKPFEVGSSAPADTTKLWIDTTASTGGLKYYDGTAWVPVPVIWG